MSSAKVVAIIKRNFKKTKVGHAGTLDPFASGVLPIAVGEATKTISFAQDHNKEYVFTLQFGKQTDTLDPEGKVILESEYIPSKEEVEMILPKFCGKILQTPPIFSALKVNGKRAYELARADVEFELKPREVSILSLDLIDYSPLNRTATLRVECGKGTYIRSLARDIAYELGSCAYVLALRRTKVGIFCEKSLISLEKIEQIVHNDSLERELRSVDIVLDDILVLYVSEEKVPDIRNGKAILVSSNEQGIVLVKSDDKPIALGNISNYYFQPTRVFNL